MRDFLRNDQRRWAAIIVAGVALILGVGVALRACSDDPTLGEVREAVHAVVDCPDGLRERDLRRGTEINCGGRSLLVYRPGEDLVNLGLSDDEFERVKTRIR